MKAAIIGANGQLGSDLCRVLGEQGMELVPLQHRDVDVADAAQVEQVLGDCKPDVVISTAAYHRVEECEKEMARAFAVNAIGPANLARTCSRLGALLVHFSTDYVFSGPRTEPWSETDLPAPASVYGVSKLAGECMVASNCKRYFVVRTCGLYGVAGSAGKGGNFVETMLKKAAEGGPIRVVDDQRLTPTFTGDLAEVIAKLIGPEISQRREAWGLYHITHEGECSWYEFARKIFEMEKVAADLKPITTAEFFSAVQRPAYSVLSKRKLKGLGLAMPRWEDGLARYLAARKKRFPQPTPARA